MRMLAASGSARSYAAVTTLQPVVWSLRTAAVTDTREETSMIGATMVAPMTLALQWRLAMADRCARWGVCLAQLEVGVILAMAIVQGHDAIELIAYSITSTEEAGHATTTPQLSLHFDVFDKIELSQPLGAGDKRRIERLLSWQSYLLWVFLPQLQEFIALLVDDIPPLP